MAPEQVQGERGDARTDVYALGVMLYEMLTGEVPYQGDSPLAVMSQRVTTDAPLLRRSRRDLPPGLEAIVYRALQRDPRQRYPSMAALREDLQHLEDVEIPTYAASATRRGRLPQYALPVALVLAAFVCLVVIGVAAELVHRAQVGH
jgi:serine/threonine-protein kinase